MSAAPDGTKRPYSLGVPSRCANSSFPGNSLSQFQTNFSPHPLLELLDAWISSAFLWMPRVRAKSRADQFCHGHNDADEEANCFRIPRR
jgi:hypothetical protein